MQRYGMREGSDRTVLVFPAIASAGFSSPLLGVPDCTGQTRYPKLFGNLRLVNRDPRQLAWFLVEFDRASALRTLAFGALLQDMYSHHRIYNDVASKVS